MPFLMLKTIKINLCRRHSLSPLHHLKLRRLLLLLFLLRLIFVESHFSLRRIINIHIYIQVIHNISSSSSFLVWVIWQGSNCCFRHRWVLFLVATITILGLCIVFFIILPVLVWESSLLWVLLHVWRYLDSLGLLFYWCVVELLLVWVGLRALFEGVSKLK